MKKFNVDKSKRYTDVYDLGRFMPFDEKAETYDIFNSKFLDLLKDIENSGEFKVQEELIAPDAITYKLYTNSNLFWVLLFFNDITDYQKIRPGVTLKIIDYKDIENKFFKLS